MTVILTSVIIVTDFLDIRFEKLAKMLHETTRILDTQYKYFYSCSLDK